MCVKAKGTGSQHRTKVKEEMQEAKRDGLLIWSDYFYMSESDV